MLPFLLLLALSCSVSAATFTATLDRNTVAPGDTATLTATAQGGTPAAPPEAPRVPGLVITYAGQSSQLQILNGRSSSSISYSYRISSSRPGDYLIPSLSVQMAGEQLFSAPTRLTVARADPRTPQAAFLNLELPRANFYVGEVAIASIHLYAQGGNLRQEPRLSGEGPLLGTNVLVSQPVQVQTNNALYSRVSWQAPITFVKAGQFNIAADNCVLDIRVRRPTNRDPFGFGDFFSDLDVQRHNLATEPITVRVQPLPTANTPPDFRGAVGQFSLSANLTTNAVTAGDPLTLLIRITGTGALDRVAWTAPDSWKNWKSYPPSSRIEPANAFATAGTRILEQVLVPESPDIRELPAFAFSFFDPLVPGYRTVTHPAIPVTVRPGLASTAQPVILARQNTGTTAPPTTDIVHIKNRPGTFATASSPLLLRPSFLLLQLLPIVLWLAARTWRQRKDLLANNPRLRRQQHLASLLPSGLARLRQHASQGNSDEFTTTLHRLLQETLGERLDLPASAITSEAVERLNALGLDPAIATDLQALFQLVDQARYAPQRSTTDLLTFAGQAERSLKSVTSLPDRPVNRFSANTVCLLLAGSSLLFAPATLAAPNPIDLFDQANRLYEQAKYSEAASAYTDILQAGLESAAVHFNLGNAQFRAGHLGQAILHYRTALLLNPRDPDAHANLQFARQSVGTAPPSLPYWHQLITRLSLNEWTLAASAPLIILFLSLSLHSLLPQHRRPLRFLALSSFTLLLLASAGVATAWNLTRSQPVAIVISQDAPVRYGPLEVSPVHFTAVDGMELRLLDQDASWFQVSDIANRIGWISGTNVTIFPENR